MTRYDGHVLIVNLKFDAAHSEGITYSVSDTLVCYLCSIISWTGPYDCVQPLIISIICRIMQSFEALNQRAVAVVVDPIQSVKGKVVIDAFRLINPQTMMLGQEPRQTTSNLGHLNKPSIQVMAPQPGSLLLLT